MLTCRREGDVYDLYRIVCRDCGLFSAAYRSPVHAWRAWSRHA